MKKLILATFALTAAASVFAQGTIVLNNRFTTGNPQTTHIYAPLGPSDMVKIVGLGAGDTPAGGTTDFGGRALIGANGTAGQYGAAGTFAQFIAAVGANVPVESLQPVGQTTTFRTGGGAGFLSQITATLFAPGFGDTGGENDPVLGPFTFSIVAWDNSSGLYPTWAEARPAWLAGGIAAGMMNPFTVNSLAKGTIPAGQPTQAGQVLTSFNLYLIPEPGSFALLGLGAAALLIFRRRK